ncbi:MAG: hypothetical protein LLG01_17510 [Planctomycetaceae bacterium]|nr:hypothetical protein [Planctomycetaceae bacterium]
MAEVVVLYFSMIVPSDSDYQETKAIKKRGKPLPSPFLELAAWVTSYYNVHVLNIRYDRDLPEAAGHSRLYVILEFERDVKLFRGDDHNFFQAEQGRVLQQFKQIIGELGDLRFPTERLFVVFSAFEQVARIEANQRVTEGALERLRCRLTNPELWKISRLFETATFFFMTEIQAKRADKKGLKEVYANEYARLVEPYDEFGYLAHNPIPIAFDSKENFDTNYNGSWFNYYR